MKKEMISFAIGAGIVGCIWAGTAFVKCESKSAVIESAQKNMAAQPNLRKKPLPSDQSLCFLRESRYHKFLQIQHLNKKRSDILLGPDLPVQGGSYGK